MDKEDVDIHIQTHTIECYSAVKKERNLLSELKNRQAKMYKTMEMKKTDQVPREKLKLEDEESQLHEDRW